MKEELETKVETKAEEKKPQESTQRGQKKTVAPAKRQGGGRRE